MRIYAGIGILLSLAICGCQKLGPPVGHLTIEYDSNNLDSLQWVTIDGDTFRKQYSNNLPYGEDVCSDSRFYVELSLGNHVVAASNGLLNWQLSTQVVLNECTSAFLYSGNATNTNTAQGVVVFSNGGTSGFGRFDIQMDGTFIGSLGETIPYGGPPGTVRAVLPAGIHEILAPSPNRYFFNDTILVRAGQTRYVTLERLAGTETLILLNGCVLVSFASVTYPNVQVFVNGQYVGTTTQIGVGIDASLNYQAFYEFSDYGTSTTQTNCFNYSANTTDGLHTWSGSQCYFELTGQGGGTVILN